MPFIAVIKPALGSIHLSPGHVMRQPGSHRDLEAGKRAGRRAGNKLLDSLYSAEVGPAILEVPSPAVVSWLLTQPGICDISTEYAECH